MAKKTNSKKYEQPMFGVVNAYGFCVDARPSGKEAEGKAELLIGQTLQPWHVVEGVFTWAKK